MFDYAWAAESSGARTERLLFAGLLTGVASIFYADSSSCSSEFSLEVSSMFSSSFLSIRKSALVPGLGKCSTESEKRIGQYVDRVKYQSLLLT